MRKGRHFGDVGRREEAVWMMGSGAKSREKAEIVRSERHGKSS